MNQKLEKTIRKYARLRGKNEIAINPKLLRQVYIKATPEMQKVYREEMQDYFDAIDQKKIKPGDSYLHSILSVVDDINADEQNTGSDT